MQIYLISHTQVCDIKNIAHLCVRYKKYRTLILIKKFQAILKPFYEMMLSYQLYIGSPNHHDCGFANIFLIKHVLRVTTYKCLKLTFTMVKT